MIVLRPLPHAWGSMLWRITDKLTDCRAVIAGGAIRDLLLGAVSSVRDLDIVVLGPSGSTVQNLTESFGKPPCWRHLDESRGAYGNGPVWRWPELRLSYEAPLIDLVAMAEVPDVAQLLDKFDIGLVQAAHDVV